MNARARARGQGGSRALKALGFSASIVAASLAPRAAAAEEPPGPDYLVSEEGHPFRVRFDPASRVRLGAGVAFALPPEGGVDQTLEVVAGLGVRTIYTWGTGQDTILWQVDQRFITGWVWPLRRPVEGIPALDVALYFASLHRHDEAPSVVLPLSPPRSVPFPFDLGFEAEAGRIFVPAFLRPAIGGGPPLPMFRATPLRMTAFLNPWRSSKPGRAIEIGIGARYDVEPYAAPSFDEPRTIHRVAPGTVGSLRFRFQSEDGLLVINAGGEVVPHWTSDTTWHVMVLGSARVERTLIAINDQPIGLVLDGNYRRNPESSFMEASHDLRVGLALELGFSLR